MTMTLIVKKICVVIVVISRRCHFLILTIATNRIVPLCDETLEKVIRLRGVRRILPDRRALLSQHLFLWVLDPPELSCSVVDVVVNDTTLIVFFRLVDQVVVLIIGECCRHFVVERLDGLVPLMHLV